MRARKSITLTAAVLLVLALSQSSKTTSRVVPVSPPPEAVFLGSAARIDTTASGTFVNFPAPGQVFTTTNYRNILVQFVTSARVTIPGEYLELRALVDGVPVNPGPMRYTGTELSSVAYSGWASAVAPGTHTVTLQWRVTGGSAVMENRTNVVWVIGQGAAY